MTLRRKHRREWERLEKKQRELIPDAYFDESKRIQLCLIDAKIMKIKREVQNEIR